MIASRRRFVEVTSGFGLVISILVLGLARDRLARLALPADGRLDLGAREDRLVRAAHLPCPGGDPGLLDPPPPSALARLTGSLNAHHSSRSDDAEERGGGHPWGLGY